MKVYTNDQTRVESNSADSEALLDAGIPIRIITHNIRYANDKPVEGEEKWPIRCPRLCSELVFNSHYPDAAFICLQEVLHRQLLDIHDGLNHGSDSEWSYIGVGRDDGATAGEYSPIFYRPSVWQLEHWETMWLSETPDTPSKGWDADSIRIVTIGYFSHIATKCHVVVMCTHLDNNGVKSRAESAKLILKVVHQRIGDSIPVILAGDFNSPLEDAAYKIMTASDSQMSDARRQIPKPYRYGNEMTFTDFGGKDAESPSLIDFVFVKDSRRVEVKSYGVLSNKFDDNVYNSDHRAVIVDLIIKVARSAT